MEIEYCIILVPARFTFAATMLHFLLHFVGQQPCFAGFYF
jgi:hypothetical protein